MKSYAQRCGLAKALDIVGDRWTLLIVRELLIRGTCRYTDIKKGLPGVASNLLVDRLRELESAGLIGRRQSEPPIATDVFELTQRGRALEGAILQLGLWGAPLLGEPAKKGEVLRAHWLVLPLRLFLGAAEGKVEDASLELRVEGEVLSIECKQGKIDVGVRHLEAPDVVLSGPAEILLRLFKGALTLPAAKASGLTWRGDRTVVDRILAARIATTGAA